MIYNTNKHHPILGKKIFVIVAHPDDEGYLVSGTSYLNAKAGGTTTIICATLGEKGTSHLSKPVSPARLKAIRKQELLNATRHAKVDKLHILNFPDGRVKQHQVAFTKQCGTLAKEERPEIVISFGPDGWTGHRDHIATFVAARAVAKKFSLPHYVTTPAPHHHEVTVKQSIRGRVNPHYDDIIPYQMATVAIRIPRVFKDKVLSFYPSQITSRRHAKKSRRKKFTFEYFALMKNKQV